MQGVSTSLDSEGGDNRWRTRRHLVAALTGTALSAVRQAPLEARKRKKKPATRTVTRTYVNDGQIRIPDRVGGIGPANPYPASIVVTDLAGGRVSNVTVTIKDLTHDVDREVGVMLAKDAINAVLMLRTGGLVEATNVTLTFDDLADSAWPVTTPLTSGRFQPTMNEAVANLHYYFIAPAPAPGGNSLLSAFQGIDPNGSWRLYVADGAVGLDGGISGGWELTITADVPKKRRKKKKRRRIDDLPRTSRGGNRRRGAPARGCSCLGAAEGTANGGLTHAGQHIQPGLWHPRHAAGVRLAGRGIGQPPPGLTRSSPG